MHQDPKVMAMLGGPKTPEEAERWLTENLTHWSEHGFGIWIFRTASDGRFVGRSGLRRVAVGGGSEVELAYALVAKRWGVGLATEMATKILDAETKRTGVDNVITLIDANNTGSRRVAEKLGFQFEREVLWKGLPAMLGRRKGILCL
jgi:ribosomal-protein-alanine N-acetyltransferase